MPTPTTNISCWEDDPISTTDVVPIDQPSPDMSNANLRIRIAGTTPAVNKYAVGTPNFRYWTAAEALRRGANFWASLLPTGIRWQTGTTSLKVSLDEGVDLNAYYDRTGLLFYHDTVGGRTVYSGESPDVLCHELGHAVLDAIKPQLWNTSSKEVDAFHESFGDMSAILVALQLPTVRSAVLVETGGRLYRSNRVSRVAEQLGWALRQVRADLVDPDCLRNAVNSFFYRDPDTIPVTGPASILSSAPHSFSRVFTGAFFEALAGMVEIRNHQPTSDDLLQVSIDAGKLLVEAIILAPVVPDYYSQVAAHMIEADEDVFDGKYNQALRGAFIRHGVLTLGSVTEGAGASGVGMAGAALGIVGGAGTRAAGARGITSRRGLLDANMGVASLRAALPTIALSASQFGLGDRALMVQCAGQTKRFSVVSAGIDLNPAAPPSYEKAAQSFVEALFHRGRVEVNQARYANSKTAIRHPFSKKTHALVEVEDHLELQRLKFDCGLDCC